jgi:hypothetical protein
MASTTITITTIVPKPINMGSSSLVPPPRREALLNHLPRAAPASRDGLVSA